MPGAFLWGWDATAEAWVKCVVNADGKLIINPTGFLENPPTEDQALKAPTSEWAYDHWKNVSAHHAATVAGDLDHQDLANRSTDDHHTKYTDVNARGAIGDLLNSQGHLDKVFYCKYKSLYQLSRVQLQHEDTPLDWVYMMPDRGGQIIKFYGYVGGVGTSACFINLYDGAAYQAVVDAGTFQSYLDDYLENPPVEDSADTAPTSEWAYDHWKDAAAHHAKYTDGEAVGAFFARKLVLDTGTYTNESMTGISYVHLNSTGGDIEIKGLADGTEGQIIFFIQRNSSDTTTIHYNSGDAAAGDKILTTTKANVTIPDYASFFMVYDGTYWICNNIS